MLDLSLDLDSNRDVSEGTQVFVTDGTLNARSGWSITTTNPINVGTTGIVFEQSAFVNAAQLQALVAAAAESAAAVAEQAGIATDKAGEASDSADEAVAALELSQGWAAAPEDLAVSGGLFSALHYAAKAAASLANIANGMAGWIHGATDETPPTGADEIGIADSAAAWGLKRLSLTNLASWLAGLTQTLTNKTLTTPTINGGTISGITDLAIADGGTGASTAATAFANLKQAATAMATGVVELATTAEFAAGTDTARVPSVSTMGNHQGMAKAWVNFNGTGTVAIRDSFNVSSITDNGTGDYTVNFANAMPNANYAVAGMAVSPAVDDNMTLGLKRGGAYSASAVQVTSRQTSNANAPLDSPTITLLVLGD